MSLGKWLVEKIVGGVKGMENLNAEQFANKLKQCTDCVLIDVREADEFIRGHIRGARNVPLSELDERIGSIPKNRELLVYCQGGVRSRKAAKILSEHGFTDIVNLQSGLLSWPGEKVK